MKNIEVELRGLLSKKKFLELNEFFRKKGKFKESKNRILIDYSIFLSGQGIENRTKDIRLRVTNGVPEIIVKIGRWGGLESRKEISILAYKGDFDKLVEAFAVMGFERGVLCVRKIEVYEYKNVEFSLVEVPGHSYYFEAEKLINTDQDREIAKQEIAEVCKELELDVFDDKSFFAYIRRLNKEVNEVFEFKNHTKNYFKNRFNL